MKKIKWGWLTGILTVALGVAAIIAITQATRAIKANAQLEEVYQSALIDTVDTMGSMAVKLEKVLITEGTGNNVLLLSQISNQATGAQKNLSLLPLSHDATGPFIRFCAQTSEYAQSLSRRLADGETMSIEEEKQVAELLSQCTLLMGQLFVSYDEMSNTNLTFLSDTNVFYENIASNARPLESIGEKDNGMDYPTLIYDGAFSDGRHLGTPKALPGNEITIDEAMEKAKQFVGEEGVTDVRETFSQTGVIPAYGVQVTKNGLVLTLEMTKKGGKVLLMMPESASFETLLSMEEAKNKALTFLESRGFTSMEANHYQTYEGLAVINFTATQDGVSLYPDMVKVQLRLDTGEVVGLEANNYWMNHTTRSLETPSLSEDDARERVSSKLAITGARLCVIPFRGGEKLCYEFAGSLIDSDYMVYIDALTGDEVEILKIIPMENGVMAV